ncbi:MAG: alpha/beta hydrolase [Bacteroidota bacterium]
MKKNIAALLLFLLSATVVFAQNLPFKAVGEKIKAGQKITAEDFGFKAYHVIVKGDTVNFYTYQKGKGVPTSIYMNLPGSDAQAIYTYNKDTDGSYWFNSLTTFNFSYLPDDFLFVIVGKPGFGFFGDGSNKKVPSQYWAKTSLQDRVWRADVALNYVRTQLVKKPNNVAVFGYSEGFYVAAKLAIQNKYITHLGIGGGGGYSDFYDFVLSNLKEVTAKTKSADSAIAVNNKIINNLEKIMEERESTKMKYGYTFKRWASFAEPALENLIQINVPIYQVHGTNDESTPIESAYIVPIEFARLKKTNLTFKVFPDANHSLITQTDGKEVNHWNEMLIGFFSWIKKKSW